MIKEMVYKQIKKQKKLYIMTSIVFFVGICLGVACVNNLDQTILDKFKKYFFSFQNSIIKMENTDIKNLFLSAFLGKSKYIGAIFILSCTVIGSIFIYFLILYKGFSLGYIISAMIRAYGTKKGILFSIITLGIQNIIYIPCIIFFAVYSINFCKTIKNRNVDIKKFFLKYFFVFLIILMISTLATTLELLISYKIINKINFFS